MEVGAGVEFIKLKKTLVDFLVQLNINRRDDSAVDKAFVKGLVIAVFTVQKIKKNEHLNPDLIEFIKGKFMEFQIQNTKIYVYGFLCVFTDLFLFRVGSNDNRISSFDGMFREACGEIRGLKK